MLRDLLRILMVGAFIIAVGALVFDEIWSSVFERSRAQHEQDEIVTRDSERLMRGVVDLTTSVRSYALSGDARHLEPYDAADAALPLVFADLHRCLVADPTGDQLITRMEGLFHAWRRDVSDPLVARRRQPRAGVDEAAGARVNDTSRQLLTQLRQETDRFREHQRAVKKVAHQALERRRDRARLFIIGVFVAAAAFIVVATLYLSRRLSRGITRLVEVSESIANARFDVAIHEERDDLGRLAHSLTLTARQLDRRTRQSQALLAAGRALSAPEAQGQLLPALHDAIREIVELQQLMLLRVDGAETSVVSVHPPLPATSDVPIDRPGPIRENGALAYAIATRRSLIVNDVRDDRWGENAPARQAGASWYCFVPLVAGGRVAAVLAASASSSDGNHYHGDQAFFDLLGQQIAGALTSARLYGELAQRNLELERAGRAKSDFLALMSHELRTPLNSIIGFSQVIIDQKYGTLTERQARYLQNIYSSGRHLLQLINDLLDLSKIEAGRFTVEIDRCSLTDLVLDAMTTLKPQADVKQLVVRNAAPPPPVRADALRLKQVLYNVLSNAIKFTPPGGMVTLGHELVDEGRSVRFAVSDTGPGISEEDQQRLFLPFVQVGTAAMQGLGSGLGLLLSRQLIELMGGQLGVRSVLGQGATFYFDLPLAQPPAPRALPAPHPTPPGGTTTPAPLALIVDDQLAARELLQEELEALGYRTLLADGGEAALMLAREHTPDLVTLDLLMPEVDGWHVLRRLREEPKLAAIPALVISITDESARALAAGALDCLVKPLQKGELHEVLVRHRLVRPRLRVLAVDDDLEHLDMLRLLLEPLGYELRTAETAAAGMQAALSAPSDVMLLDVQLPDRSGIEVVSELRTHDDLKALPILLLTGSELSADDHARLNGEVLAELGKGGLRPDELIRHIEQAVNRGRRTEEV